jgi:hypothetical protein
MPTGMAACAGLEAAAIREGEATATGRSREGAYLGGSEAAGAGVAAGTRGGERRHRGGKPYSS